MNENQDNESIQHLRNEFETIRAAIEQNKKHTADIDGRVIATAKALEQAKVELKSKANQSEIDGLRRTQSDNATGARTKAKELEGRIEQVSNVATRVAGIIDGKVVPDKHLKRILRNIRNNWKVISTIVSFVAGTITFFAGLSLHQYTAGVRESLTAASEEAKKITLDLKKAEDRRVKLQLDIGPKISSLTREGESVKSSVEKIGLDVKRLEEERSKLQLDFSPRLGILANSVENIKNSIEKLDQDLKKAAAENGKFQLEFSQRLTAQETQYREKLLRLDELNRRTEALQDLIKEIKERQPSRSMQEQPIIKGNPTTN